MIRVVYIANPFDARAVEVEDMPYRAGMVADDAVPPRLTLRDSLTLRVNGQPAELASELVDGDVVTVGAMPTDPFTATALGKSILAVGAAASKAWAGIHVVGQMILGSAALSALSRLFAPSPA